MAQEDSDLEQIKEVNRVMAKLGEGQELTDEEKKYLKSPESSAIKVEEKKGETKKMAEPIVGANATNVGLGITLDDYLNNPRVSAALKAQINTKSYMIQGAQFFATMALLEEVKKLNSLLSEQEPEGRKQLLKRK